MQEQSKLFPDHRRLSGERYTLDSFRTAYGLSHTEAERLFEKFGPSKRELDLLMRARQDPRQFLNF
ncbi:hypothetical protein GR158_01965 [Shinella sp. AETb1-6]|jgi:hypothetical protein|uniref:Uncharacterized protein n=1 Tax=Shinella sumterensis TaxID=1967501 RepID=A0AA50H8G9_9HYPH|nr:MULTISPECIES: hypothetical protein [Shinella]MDP9590002.1 hypothetical protein [Shinella zoogloeoides]MCD1263428.1 hypothetical protein [Shinella sumterensis]MXN49869.1 hypothetical protein [Shinella sp. AETb1-6]TFE99806.1 hypothetical protein B5M44_03780 [Shinella sumterensis]WLR98086.1 hypothetical protein Q9313_03395 [Shinella sumterensis]